MDSSEANKGGAERPQGNEQLMKYANDLARIYQAERAKRAALHVAVQTTRRILDSIGDGVIVIDSDRKILDTNPAFRLMTGLEDEEIVDKTVDECEHLSEFVAGMNRPARGSSRIVEFTVPRARPRQIEAVKSSYSDEAGRELGQVWVLRDVTSQKRAEDTRKEFLALVSHELRTPLTSVLGYADLLDSMAGDELTETQHSFIHTILENARELRNIVDQILAFTSIDTTFGGFSPKWIDLRSLLEALRDEFAASAERHKVHISLISPDEEVQVRADVSLLRRALSQIVDNAIRYNKEDGTVTISVSPTDGGGAISVQDTGRGIPKDEQQKIFEPFYRVEEFMRSSTRGIGLGLPLAQRIVQWHGGVISIESTENVGTECRIDLPRDPVTSPHGMR